MLLSSNGLPMMLLGGKHAYKTKNYGDICLSLQWVQGDPAMCLWSTRSRLEHGVYVIPMGNMSQYVKSNGYPEPALVELGIKIANQIGTFPDKFTVMRICDIVLENTDDLYMMPPEPAAVAADKRREERPVQDLELSVKVGGKVIHEANV